MSGVIRFQADEDFRGAIIAGLRRQPDIDILSAAEEGTIGLPDPRVLAHAAELGRILLSHDLSTMPSHFGAYLASGQHSPGLLLVPQSLPIGQTIEELHLVSGASTPDEWYDRLRYLPL